MIVDSREPEKFYNFINSSFPGLKVSREPLFAGDYRSDTCLFERKTINDLYGSVMGSNGKQGRLWKQMEKLATYDEVRVGILITGNMVGTCQKMQSIGIKMDPDLLYGTIGEIGSRYGYEVMWVEDELSGIISMVKYMTKCDKGLYGVPKRYDPDILTARLLRVTLTQWLDLKKKFKTLEGLGQASERDVRMVYGIGPAKAKYIAKVLNDKW